MASSRPRSFLDLPDLKPKQASTRPRSELPRSPSPSSPRLATNELMGMPISFGVLLLALGLTLVFSAGVSWLVYRNAQRADEASRATERRLSKELTQLRAHAATLQAQLELRAHDVATQSRELERISAELESMHGRGGADARSGRPRRSAKP